MGHSIYSVSASASVRGTIQLPGGGGVGAGVFLNKYFSGRLCMK